MLNDGGIVTTPTYTASAGTESQTLSGTFTMGGTSTGGTLTITEDSTGGNRFIVTGNFSATAGTIDFSGTPNSNVANLAALYLDGGTNSIGSGVTISGINGDTLGSVAGPQIAMNSTSNQSLTYGTTSVFNMFLRNTSASGSTSTKTITYNGTLATGQTGGYIGTVQMSSTGDASTTTTIFQLGSNLEVASGSGLVTTGEVTQIAIMEIDLNGNTYDGSTLNTSSNWAPTNSTAGTDSWVVDSSQSGGVFKAGSFSFTPSGKLNITIGNNVTLDATASGGSNQFGVSGSSGSVVSFNAGSTFEYTGVGSASISTDASGGNTTLGKVVIGSGSTASTLTVSGTAFQTPGSITINNEGTLSMGTKAFSSNASPFITLNAGGTLTDGSGTQANVQNLIGDINSSASGTAGDYFVGTSSALALSSALNMSGLTSNAVFYFAGNVTNSGGTGSITLPSMDTTYKIASNSSGNTIDGSLLPVTGDGLEIVAGSVTFATNNAPTTGGLTIDSGASLTTTLSGSITPGTVVIGTNASLNLGLTTMTGTSQYITINSGGTLSTTTTSASTFNSLIAGISATQTTAGNFFIEDNSDYNGGVGVSGAITLANLNQFAVLIGSTEPEGSSSTGVGITPFNKAYRLGSVGSNTFVVNGDSFVTSGSSLEAVEGIVNVATNNASNVTAGVTIDAGATVSNSTNTRILAVNTHHRQRNL